MKLLSLYSINSRLPNRYPLSPFSRCPATQSFVSVSIPRSSHCQYNLGIHNVSPLNLRWPTGLLCSYLHGRSLSSNGLAAACAPPHDHHPSVADYHSQARHPTSCPIYPLPDRPPCCANAVNRPCRKRGGEAGLELFLQAARFSPSLLLGLLRCQCSRFHYSWCAGSVIAGSGVFGRTGDGSGSLHRSGNGDSCLRCCWLASGTRCWQWHLGSCLPSFLAFR